MVCPTFPAKFEASITHSIVLQALLAASLTVMATSCVQRVPATPRAQKVPSSADNGTPPVPKPPEKRFVYPESPRGTVVDNYHGIEVADPYRWLEDTDSSQTRTWIEAQNRIAFQHLESIPQRREIQQRLSNLWNYEKFGVPLQRAGRVFYTQNSGLQNQSVLYWAKSMSEQPTVLLDPNKMSEDGTVALNSWSISEDGKHIVYSTQSGGSDWLTWRVREIESGEDLPDTVKWSKFSGAAWAHNGSGFYYSRYPEPQGAKLRGTNVGQALYFHKLRTDQSKDKLVYQRPNESKWMYQSEVTNDGKYLLIHVSKGTGENSLVFYQNLRLHGRKTIELVNQWEAEYSFIDNVGPVFYFKTDYQAPRGRIVAIDVRRPGKQNWQEIVPQSASKLNSVSLVGDRFIASYLEDAKARVSVFSRNGKRLGDVPLPGMGATFGFAGKRSDRSTFFAFSQFAAPPTIYRYDVARNTVDVVRAPRVDFDKDRYAVTQVFYKSKDGTKVPMFLVHRKDITLDGMNPTLLYGYGGFSISLTPRFDVKHAVWLELGGVFAMPNLRGGGEYGEEWHLAGTKLAKQNVFDDFIAAAEWLIANKYTSPSKLAIRGASNGGLLVGAAITQRPDLFGAAIPAVGVMDMLRFHKFTIGWAWVDDYGSPENPEEFKALRAYSPYHNIRPGRKYPATLVTTGDHDDRVVPGHSFKFAAALQAADVGNNPVLIRVETRGGHGAGKPTDMRIALAADELAFLADSLGIKP